MCGLILLDAGAHGVLEPGRYTELCARVGGRGPHSHGWALLDEQYKWHLQYAEGPITDVPSGVWRMALGHSRLATSGGSAGTLPNPEHGQPIVNGNWLISHNGTLKHLISPDFLSDSHHAADRFAHGEGLAGAFDCPDCSPQAVIAVYKPLGAVFTHRSGKQGGHPLFHAIQDDVRIIASIRPDTESELTPTGTTLWTMMN